MSRRGSARQVEECGYCEDDGPSREQSIIAQSAVSQRTSAGEQSGRSESPAASEPGGAEKVPIGGTEFGTVESEYRIELIVDEKTISFNNQDEMIVMKTVLYQLSNADRNEKLLILDSLADLIESDCSVLPLQSPPDHRLISAFLVLNGVDTLLHVVSLFLDDKEVVSRSLLIFLLLANTTYTNGSVDLPITVDLCLHVAKNFSTTYSCILLALCLLREIKSKRALLRLGTECSTFRTVLLRNQNSVEVCENVLMIIGMICESSAVFRQQFLKEDALKDVLDVISLYNNRSSILISACGIFTSLISEPLFQQSIYRFTIIDLLNRWTFAATISDKLSPRIPILETLQILLGMSASCADHFIKKQGLMGIVILLDQYPDAETVATCCRVVSSICSVTNASYSILATGITSRICRAIQTSVEPFVELFYALRCIALQSLDCTQEVINAHVVPSLVRYAQKSQDNDSLLEILWTLSLLSGSCTASICSSSLVQGCVQLNDAHILDFIATLKADLNATHPLLVYCKTISENLQYYLFEGRRSSLALYSANPISGSESDVLLLVNSPMQKLMSLLLRPSEAIIPELEATLDALQSMLDAFDAEPALPPSSKEKLPNEPDTADPTKLRLGSRAPQGSKASKITKEMVLQSGVEQSLVSVLSLYPQNRELCKKAMRVFVKIAMEKDQQFSVPSQFDDLYNAVETLMEQEWVLLDLEMLCWLVQVCLLADVSHNLDFCNKIVPFFLKVRKTGQDPSLFIHYIDAVIDLLLRLAFCSLFACSL